jgi:hypothetical protein
MVGRQKKTCNSVTSLTAWITPIRRSTDRDFRSYSVGQQTDDAHDHHFTHKQDK